MPVQLPLAKRNPLVNPASVGRINLDVQDRSSEIITKSIVNLGESAVKGITQYEENVQKANEVKRKTIS